MRSNEQHEQENNHEIHKTKIEKRKRKTRRTWNVLILIYFDYCFVANKRRIFISLVSVDTIKHRNTNTHIGIDDAIEWSTRMKATTPSGNRTKAGGSEKVKMFFERKRWNEKISTFAITFNFGWIHRVNKTNTSHEQKRTATNILRARLQTRDFYFVSANKRINGRMIFFKGGNRTRLKRGDTKQVKKGWKRRKWIEKEKWMKQKKRKANKITAFHDYFNWCEMSEKKPIVLRKIKSKRITVNWTIKELIWEVRNEMRSHIHPSKHSQVNGQEKHIKSSRHRIRKCIRMRCKSNGFKCENKCEKNVEKHFTAFMSKRSPDKKSKKKKREVSEWKCWRFIVTIQWNLINIYLRSMLYLFSCCFSVHFFNIFSSSYSLFDSHKKPLEMWCVWHIEISFRYQILVIKYAWSHYCVGRSSGFRSSTNVSFSVDK